MRYLFKSAHNGNKEKKKGKNMSATETKRATAATSETIAELFHEAMRGYEKALKSGIQLQEESVNLWKELLTKLGSPGELQAKLDSMRADVFPKAREVDFLEHNFIAKCVLIGSSISVRETVDILLEKALELADRADAKRDIRLRRAVDKAIQQVHEVADILGSLEYQLTEAAQETA
jgi:hypothetical protein